MFQSGSFNNAEVKYLSVDFFLTSSKTMWRQPQGNLLEEFIQMLTVNSISDIISEMGDNGWVFAVEIEPGSKVLFSSWMQMHFHIFLWKQQITRLNWNWRQCVFYDTNWTPANDKFQGTLWKWNDAVLAEVHDITMNRCTHVYDTAPTFLSLEKTVSHAPRSTEWMYPAKLMSCMKVHKDHLGTIKIACPDWMICVVAKDWYTRSGNGKTMSNLLGNNQAYFHPWEWPGISWNKEIFNHTVSAYPEGVCVNWSSSVQALKIKIILNILRRQVWYIWERLGGIVEFNSYLILF